MKKLLIGLSLFLSVGSINAQSLTLYSEIFYDSAVFEYSDSKMKLTIHHSLLVNLNDSEFLFLMNNGEFLEFNRDFFDINGNQITLHLTDKDIEAFGNHQISKLIFRVLSRRYILKAVPKKKEAKKFRKDFKSMSQMNLLR